MEKKILSFLIRSEVIDEEKTEIYRYGLNIFIKKIIHILLFLVIGFIGGEFWGVFIFLVAYASMREYSGGYHAKSVTGCYCCTIIVSICLLILLNIFQRLDTYILYTMMLICGYTIWSLSPQEADNNPLEENEMVDYRKKTHKYLIGFGCISLAGFFLNVILKGISCAWIIQTVMLLMSEIERQKGNQ
ncbi:MAG: accessory gene regulator B family protein [Muricomes sp.]